MTPHIAQLKSWYEGKARAFLEQHEPEKVLELDRDLDRLLRTDRRASEDLAMCFLGASGVGKSTLINALVAGQENLLPAGGIGPLTALAMQVRYGQELKFEAEYQAPQNLWRLVFGMEQAFKRRHGAQPVVSGAEGEQPPTADEGGPGEESELGLEGDEVDARFEIVRRQAEKLVTDRQDGNTAIPYLLDRLRELCGQKPIWGTALNPDDASRLKGLEKALEIARAKRGYRRREAGDRAAFLGRLADHATGFLAPIIRGIQVFWDSPLLKPGITLVDLPGVGVAGDVYKTVTRKWIVEKARAVVLVVDNRGVREPDAELLLRSDFFTRLLFSVDDPDEDPAVLIAAVTQLDSPAADRYFQDPEKFKKKREHLADVSAEAVELIKRQMRQQLLAVWSRDAQTPRAAHERVVDYVIENLRVFPVSAFEFRKLLKDDEDDRAFINDAQQSGIPQMRIGLTEIAKIWRERAEAHRAEAAKAFVERAVTSLEVVEARWQQDARASEEAESLKEDLALVVAPMRKEFLVRKGEFRGFLRNEIPKLISALVSEAAQDAHKAIRAYLRGLRDAHWATLRAAVRRDGAYNGARYINLPDDFSQKFVEPIAEVWGARLLQEIRKRTRTFTDDCIAQLEVLVEWCRGQGTRVQPKLLETHVASIKADTTQINLVGKEAISDLREAVKNQLKVAIEKPIKRRCQEFVRKGDAVGQGVKLRILDLFDELAEAATADAKEVATEILTQGFRTVDNELKEVTKSFEDPLESAVEAIVSAHQDLIKRSDAQRRAAVLQAVRGAIDACPDRTQSGRNECAARAEA